MNKKEIIELLEPKCNGYDLPHSLNIELIAELLVDKQKEAINYTRGSLKLKDDIDEISDLAKTFINEVDKKHLFVNLPEDGDFYMARHKLADKLNDL
jgi:hypothetical protein